jgi:hypothetical protein
MREPEKVSGRIFWTKPPEKGNEIGVITCIVGIAER